jgi:hypothetical protein
VVALSDARAGGAMRHVLHHDYRRGDAADVSGQGNHGSVVDATFGDAKGHAGVLLDGVTSRVVVPPSNDLTELTGLRVSITVQLTTLVERSDLVEGYLSFALLVHGDGSVQGGTYNGSTWIATRSRPGVIRVQRWHEVTYLCRPWLGSLIYVDGELVSGDARGDVINRVSWPFGVSIGAWPDADRFMLHGCIGDVLIWTEEG